ncbi:MAG TPA: hypothetical protein ENK17_03945, partial [Anaerolineae bacterium]|nr:hypothetical protein [Anaerolineae bacterium]
MRNDVRRTGGLLLLMGLLAVGVALWPVSGGRAAFQAADPVRDWQQAVAQARLDEGLAPYALSRLLRAAA